MALQGDCAEKEKLIQKIGIVFELLDSFIVNRKIKAYYSKLIAKAQDA